MKKKSVLALGLVLTMSVSMVGCGSSKKTETEKVNVEVQTPQSGEVTLDTDYIGTVSPEQQVYVVPLVSGTVTQVNYAVGDTVKEGDVLEIGLGARSVKVQVVSVQEVAAKNDAALLYRVLEG